MLMGLCYEIHLSNEIPPLETKWAKKASGGGGETPA
jgi:hypothetical protein